MSMSPTQRTMRALKDQGMVCGIVEKWNRFAVRGDGQRGVRQDLFGILDIIALDSKRGVIGVQSTGTDFAGHHKKLTEEKAQECVHWLETPGTVLELWGWRKVKVKRGGKAMIWQPRVRVYTLLDFMDNDPFS